MQVTIKTLRLSYFKGIKQIELEFSPESNSILGANASGKTTIFDAVWFLFFGKDSTGRADFQIKTLNEDNTFIEKVDHEVYGVFDIDGTEKTFKRTYKQQWSKEGKLKGHTTNYEIDGFPVRLESQYRKEVEEFFAEELFKLLTNPLFFNSMKTNERRNVVIGMAEELTDDQVFSRIGSKSKVVAKLEEELQKGATIDKLRQKALMDKKAYQEKKESIPTRIDEAERSKPEPYEFDELSEVIKEKKKELEDINKEIKALENENTANNKALRDWQTKLFEAKNKLQKFEFQAEQELNQWINNRDKRPKELNQKIKELKYEAAKIDQTKDQFDIKIQKKEKSIIDIEESIQKLTAAKEKLIQEYKEEHRKEFEWNGKECPTCHRQYEGTQALNAEEEARASFNLNKKKKLDDITLEGTRIKNKIESEREEINQIKGSINQTSIEQQESLAKKSELSDQLMTLESSINEWYSTPAEERTIEDFLSDDAKAIQVEIESLEKSQPKEGEKADTSNLEESKKTVEQALENLQKAMANKETIERIEKRIQSLKIEETELAQKITEAEGIEHACFEFQKAKVEMIEDQINSKFDLVTFKLFETQLNGNEKEICDTLYSGVPFADLNNAGKIQAGLDIINALSKHNDIYLPIFIDNRESVTWVPDTQSQIINLVVDPTKTKLELNK